MLKFKKLSVTLAAATLLGSAVLAAAQSSKNATVDAAKPSSSKEAAEMDLAKLSIDGLKAFQDVRMARLEIFEGHTDQAKKYVDLARTAVMKAKADNAVFVKAEASLKSPEGVSQRGNVQGKGDAGTAPNTTPIAWLPVNGAMTISEDFVGTPAKTAAVAKANEQVKRGNHKQAMETLKLSDIDVSFVMEVAPLDKTISGIDNAAQLIDSGKYYEGNQALKAVEDSVRFDVIDANALAKK